MTDQRTPAQKAADEALTAAIAQSLAAYTDGAAAGWVVTDYVVISARTNGEATAIGIAFRQPDVPIHTSLGLIDYAHTRIRSRLLNINQ